jgi:hypothetical protein
MTIIICITKADVHTQPIGLNYQISLPGNLFINFTKEAIEELYNDMVAIDLGRETDLKATE